MAMAASASERRRYAVCVRASMHIFNSGATQNAYFFARALAKLGHDVDLVDNVGSADAAPFANGTMGGGVTVVGLNGKLVRAAAAAAAARGAPTPTTQDDVLAELRREARAGRPVYHAIVGVTQHVPSIARHAGIYAVELHLANLYLTHEVTWLARAAHADAQRDPLSELIKLRAADEVFMIQSPFAMAAYYRALIDAPRLRLEQIHMHWTPEVLLRAAAAGGGKLHFWQGPPPPPSAAALIFLDPNISPCKTSWVPALAASAVHVDDPELIEAVHVFNAPRTPHAATMLASLPIAPIARAHPKRAFTDVAAEFAGVRAVIVAHQWRCGLNYAYYDALTAGIPLVHNCDALAAAGLGYAYRDWDVDGCAAAIRRAAACTIEESHASRAAFRAWALENADTGGAVPRDRLLALVTAAESRAVAWRETLDAAR